MPEGDSVQDENVHSDCGLVLARDGKKSSLNQYYARYLTSCCRSFLRLASQLPSEIQPSHQQVVTAVSQALQRHRQSMLACFASPSVGTALQCAPLSHTPQQHRERIDRAAIEATPHLLLGMAFRKLIPPQTRVNWPHDTCELASISIGGVISAPADADGWSFESGALHAHRDGKTIATLSLTREGIHATGDSNGRQIRFSRHYYPIARTTHFATVDRNPIADLEEHPEKQGNPVDLGGHEPGEWIKSLEASFDLVETFLPSLHQEMRSMLHQAIPVGYDSQRHLSASYREAVGTIYLTLHPEQMTMTEAVIHEFQHNKLNVASYTSQYLHNAFAPRYPSPVRPDPRPLWGILLAVHAFLPVAELYRRMRDQRHPVAEDPGFDRRLSDIDMKNHEGMNMLRSHGEFTAEGSMLFADLEDLESQHLADRAARGLVNAPTAAHPG